MLKKEQRNENVQNNYATLYLYFLFNLVLAERGKGSQFKS